MANKVSKLKFNNVTYDLADESSRVAINNLEGQLEATRVDLNNMRAAVGSPLTAATTSAMTDTSKIYVYTGTTTTVSSVTFTAGNWYYHDGTKWQLGGVYNETALETDTTLTVSGAAADAKVTGDKVTELKSALDNLEVFCKKEIVESTSGSIGVTSGTVVPSNAIIAYNIPSGAEFDFVLSASGIISKYSLYVDGTNIQNGCIPGTKYTFTASANIESLGIYVSAQNAIGTGVATAVLTVTLETDDSLEQRIGDISDLETTEKSNLVGAINEVNGNIDNVLLDYSMVNRLNPAECVIGKVVNISTGELGDNANTFTTDYMPIHPNETLYFVRKDGLLTDKTNRYAAFDKDKNILPSLGETTDTNHVTQTQDMAYIRVSFDYNPTVLVTTPYGIAVLGISDPMFVPGYGASPSIKSEYIRPVVRIFATDTEAQIITKLVNAYNTSNCDVVFDRADYTFGTELEKVSTDYGMPYNEIPIGNNCRYYFNGATLTATVDLTQHPAVDNDEFYCNFFGCQRKPSSYELHDGVLIATDTRYVVHDESSALTGSYKHLYQNMEMHYHTSDRQEAIRKCLGGGTGASGVVEIVGCKFSTDASDVSVSFHGNSSDVVGAAFDLVIRDCWFSNAFRAGELSANQSARLFASGNSTGTTPTTSYARWTVTSFNNEIRT